MDTIWEHARKVVLYRNIRCTSCIFACENIKNGTKSYGTASLLEQAVTLSRSFCRRFTESADIVRDLAQYVGGAKKATGQLD